MENGLTREYEKENEKKKERKRKKSYKSERELSDKSIGIITPSSSPSPSIIQEEVCT